MSPLDLDAIYRLLDAAGVPWALIGGHAVNAWVEPRATADVDVTCAADAVGLERLRVVLDEAGLRPERVHGAEEPSGPDFIRFVSDDRRVVVEIQTAKTQLQRDTLRRAARQGDARVATPEDLLVMKLIAFRTKDQADLIALVGLPGLDWPYVEGHALDWGVLERLAHLRAALSK